MDYSMSKTNVEEYTMGRKRVIEFKLKDGTVKKIQISKSTTIDSNSPSGNALYIEPNRDGTYKLAHGSEFFNNLDDVESITIVRQDFK